MDRFHDALASWLIKRRGFSDLTIWRDRALDGNTEFNLSIENKIKHSALFFVLNSHNYHQSDYCRKELKWFHQHHGGRPGGLIVGEHHRIFNILLRNIPHQQWPEELGNTSGFTMHDAKSSDDLGDFTLTSDDLFQKQLRCIVDAVEATLAEFSKLKPTLEDREAKGHEVKIYVADVADSLQDFRDRIIAEATGAKVQVLSNIPPPMESAPHAASVEKALAQADLSIHLFDQWPGRKIIDQKTTTFPRMQWEIALIGKVRKLVWQPVDPGLTDGQDDAQQEFLDNLASGDRSAGQYEFVRATQTDFLNVIREIIAQLQLPTGNGGLHRTFLVDTHQKDQRHAFELAAFLAKNDVEVDFNQESHDSNLSLTKFEQSVRQAQNLIILAGKVEHA